MIVKEGARYTCPMHPEIRQPGPGACPQCGMALEPKTITAKGEEIRATMRNFKQNLFFAFVYNSLGVSIATGLFIRSSVIC